MPHRARQGRGQQQQQGETRPEPAVRFRLEMPRRAGERLKAAVCMLWKAAASGTVSSDLAPGAGVMQGRGNPGKVCEIQEEEVGLHRRGGLPTNSRCLGLGQPGRSRLAPGL